MGLNMTKAQKLAKKRAVRLLSAREMKQTRKLLAILEKRLSKLTRGIA